MSEQEKNWLGYDEESTPALKRVLGGTFGHKKFKPNQEELIEAARDGRDVMGILPTGSGKSLVYSLPALLAPRTSPTLVVMPLLALIRQQRDKLRHLDLPVDALFGETEDRDAVFERLVSGNTGILLTTPEQMHDSFIRELAGRVRFGRLVVDEAHCTPVWGQDFRLPYSTLGELRHRMGINNITALTATASEATVADVGESLMLDNPLVLQVSPFRKNLKYETHQVDDARAKKVLMSRLLKSLKLRTKDGSAIVYCSSIREVNDVWDFLRVAGLGGKVEQYHGQQPGFLRQQYEDGFLNGDVKVLVATKAFGMGIDKSNIRMIVHYNVPGTVEDYLQETGRAGRDGKKARCVLMYTPRDLNIQGYFNKQKTPEMDLVARIYNYLKERSERSTLEVIKASQRTVFERLGTKSRGRRWRKSDGPSISSTSIGASMKLLIDAGVISMFGADVELVDQEFAPGSEKWGRVEELRGQRKGVAEDALRRITDYAEGEASQERLIELLG